MPLPIMNAPVYELTIPSTGKKIKYRPFLVKEEKILLLAMESEDSSEMTNAILQIIQNCVQTKIKVEDLATFDVEYIFMNIRAKAVGEILEFSVVCPDDNETEVDVEVNIEDIKVEKSEGHENKIDLENGYGLVMKYPSIKYAIQNSEKLSNNKIDAEFELIVDCIEQIYNSEEVWETNTCSREEVCEFVEKFNSKQYQKVKSFFDTMPKLKHTIQVKNPKTGVVSPVTIEGLNNFFA